MPTPTAISDYWSLRMDFNFSSPSFEFEQGQNRGWTERYFQNVSYNSPPAPPATPYGLIPNTVYAWAIALVQARCALMATNVTMFRQTLSLGSLFRDRWPLGPIVNYPLLTFQDIVEGDGGVCNEVEDALLFRVESGTTRFHSQIRGVRDRWISDNAFTLELSENSYGPWRNVGSPAANLDAGAPPALMTPGATGGTNGSIAFTIVSGQITAIGTITPGTGLTFNGVNNTTFAVPLTPPDFDEQLARGLLPQFLTFTLNSSGAIVQTGGGAPTITAATSYTMLYPAGFLFTINAYTDALTLQPYLDDKVYVQNFGSALLTCSHFKFTELIGTSTLLNGVGANWPIRPPQTTSFVPVADSSSPSYIVPTTNRFMIERVSSRRTGRQKTTKSARKKIAR